MSTENWEPQQQEISLDPEQIKKYIALGVAEKVTDNCLHLNKEIVSDLQHLKTKNIDFWQPLICDLNTADIHNLIRFFILAEENESSLFVGNDSPVIAFNKVLKRRKEPLDKDFLVWIKEHSSNKFLPNGSIF